MPKAARKSTLYSRNDKILKITMAGSTRNGVIYNLDIILSVCQINAFLRTTWKKSPVTL